ncbi:MAG: hypothetical protein V3V30_05715 [Parvularculaceae bacterium]
MRNTLFTIIAILGSLGIFSSVHAASITEGSDLSSDFFNPTLIGDLDIGANTITGTLRGSCIAPTTAGDTTPDCFGPTSDHIDVVRFDLAPGLEITGLTLIFRSISLGDNLVNMPGLGEWRVGGVAIFEGIPLHIDGGINFGTFSIPLSIFDNDPTLLYFQISAFGRLNPDGSYRDGGTGDYFGEYTLQIDVATVGTPDVPLPGAAWFMITGLAGFAARKRAKRLNERS